MEKIIVDVAWCDRNYGGSLGSNVPGAVVFTAPNFDALQKEAKDSLEFQIRHDRKRWNEVQKLRSPSRARQEQLSGRSPWHPDPFCWQGDKILQ